MADDRLPDTLHSLMLDYAQRVGIAQPTISVSAGSKNGDSFSGDLLRVVIRPANSSVSDEPSGGEEQNIDPHFDQFNGVDGGTSSTTTNAQSLHFIVKMAPQNEARRASYNIAIAFAREKYIYEQILPAFEAFQHQHLDAGSIFRHYPRMIDASLALRAEYVVLNDLRASGYANAEKSQPLGWDQTRLVIEHLAKFHAISFAFKDQQAARFDELTGQLTEVMFVEPLAKEFSDFLRKNVEYAVSTLQEPDDGAVAEKVRAFGEVYGAAMIECCAERSHAVVLHGDCWISNLMFKPNSSQPEQVQFLDWQGARCATVAIDLSYFLFCCTDADVRLRMSELLSIYHTTLVDRITALGSQGATIFPAAVFDQQMRQYSKFGFGMAVMTVHATACPADELADISKKLDTTNLASMHDLAMPLVQRPAYRKRMAAICRDMVRLGYL